MEALNKIFALLKGEDSSQTIVGIFSTCEIAKKEIENIEEKNGQFFYIQEWSLDSTRLPVHEVEVSYSTDGCISEMIVTRNDGILE